MVPSYWRAALGDLLRQGCRFRDKGFGHLADANVVCRVPLLLDGFDLQDRRGTKSNSVSK